MKLRGIMMHPNKNKHKIHKTSGLPLVPFYYIRHGQTDWNKEDRFMGQTDIPLNETGLEQARVAAQSLVYIPFAAIVSSPLQRALATAEIISQATGKSITIVDELKEVNLGIMEGKHKGDGTILQKWRQGKFLEGAEQWSEYTQRILKALTISLSHPAPVLIVGHGAFYHALQEVLQLSDANGLHNCHVVLHMPPDDADGNWIVQGLEMEYD